MFAHLHVHTEYSLLDGMCSIPRLIARASELGMRSLAITDHGNMYGVIDFYQAVREAGIKPIIGSEMYVAPRGRFSRTAKDKQSYHLTLLAKNSKGYHNLIQLTTKAHLEGYYYKPRIDWELLQQHHEGLIALSGCPQGEIPRLILAGDEEGARKAALKHKDLFDDYYLEIQRHPIAELDKVNDWLIALGRELDIPLVATNDTHFVNQEDAFSHELLLCVQTNSTIYDEKRMKLGDTFYLRSGEEMAQLFADLPEAIQNTERIADMCALELEFDQPLLPEVETPHGESAEEYLEQMCRAGLAQRFDRPPEEATARLEYELDVIRKTNFANYFLVVWDLICFAKERGILFGVRGSAAASIVLYSLGITNINPLEHSLVFERFLNVERKEMPDIDLDFQDDRREEVIGYAAQRYGYDRVAQIITFGTFGARAALRDVGRALGMPFGDVDRVARMVPFAPNMTLDRALEENHDFRGEYQDNEAVRQLVDNAKRLEGISRHASTHAAGVVISSRPLSDHVPLQKPMRADEDAIAMTQFHMEAIARIGLLKLDVLGLVNLTILHRTKEIITQTPGAEVDLRHIPLHDANTFRLLSSGETTGVFQLEGSGMRRFVKELKPSSFSDVAAMIALYRPGPMQHIPTFIRAKHGLEPIHFPHHALAEILEETYGVIVYQDQVLLIVRAFAGYGLGEADIFRKAMGKKIPEVMRKEKEHFLSGAQAKGFSQELAREVFDLIEPFAGYAFNKAHSVSYAMIAYQTAYFKANYPVEFMTALLTVHMGQPERIGSAVAECRRMDIPVLPPDVNKSETTFSIEDVDGRKGIRFALGAVKNVGVAAVAPIIASRTDEGAFTSIEDFCRKADLRAVNKRALESLIKVGALDCLHSRGALLANIDRIMTVSHSEQRLKQTGQSTMFDLWGESVPSPMPSLELNGDEVPLSDKLAWEKELLGTYVSEHPFGQAAHKLASHVSVFCGQIDEEMAGQEVATAGIVTAVRHLSTKDGRPFVSATLEDLDGTVEATAWPNIYQDTKDLWTEGTILLVEGKVRVRAERVQLACQSARQYRLEEGEEELPQERHRLFITIHETADRKADVDRLRQILDTLQDYTGEDQVRVRVTTAGREVNLEFPDMMTGYCPELHQRLATLAGEDNVAVDV